MKCGFEAAFPGNDFSKVKALPATDPKFGDFQCNDALAGAKVLHLPPRKIAEAVYAKLMESKPAFIDKVELAGPGFLNITVSADWLAAQLAALGAQDTLGIPQTGAGKRVVLDYSSPNAAKQMHIGHIRSTVIGNAIDRIFRALGYNVVADNHLGDWGTQFGILIKRWEKVVEMVRIARAHQQKLPILAFEESSRAVAMLRDLLNPTYESVYINDERIYQEIRDYVSLIAPESVDIVKHYKGIVPIFDNFSVTKQIKTSFGKSVTYKHGAYLVIEQTEALHVIDVNSGNRSKSPDGQEANALDVNLGAADEIARQLRLRDLGGIIVVDFIDMDLPENRQKLYERMVENLKQDRARHNILPLSKFGLMQITRQRVRPAMSVSVDEGCPTCGGQGVIKSSLLFTDTLEEKVHMMVEKFHIKRFRLHVHPFVAAYLNQGVFSIKRHWQMKYGLGVRIIPNQQLAYLQYEFYDEKGREISMKQEGDFTKS